MLTYAYMISGKRLELTSNWQSPCLQVHKREQADLVNEALDISQLA